MEPILTFPRSKFAWLVSNHSINLLSTTAHRYFVSVAVFAKMNAATEGYFCNLDVYHLYAEAVRQRVSSLFPISECSLRFSQIIGHLDPTRELGPVDY